MSWDLKQLREEVERRFGVDQCELLSPCLESVRDRQFYARFHLQESTKFLKEFVAARQSRPQLFNFVIGNDAHDPDGFYWRKKQAEAHITACLQSIHSVSDILAHVLYYSLGMNRFESTSINPRGVSISSVRGRLNENPEVEDIIAAVSSLVDHSEYQYVTDIVNHSKHRSIVGTCFSVDASEKEEPSCSLEFHSFKINGDDYPCRPVDSLLESEYARQESLVINIGELLNRSLKEPK